MVPDGWYKKTENDLYSIDAQLIRKRTNNIIEYFIRIGGVDLPIPKKVFMTAVGLGDSGIHYKDYEYFNEDGTTKHILDNVSVI